MKTKGSILAFLLAAWLCGLGCYLGQTRALAATNPACSTSPCENAYAWWVTGQTTQGVSAQAPGMGLTQNTTNAILNIYVFVPSGTNTPTSAAGTFDSYTWAMATGTCWDNGGNPQSPQLVTPQGAGNIGVAGINRRTCTKPP
jgi:hypothetical protein